MDYYHSFHIKQATHALKNGGVIAYPTEGVWGLGCDPFRECAVERLIELKKRDKNKGLIVLASDFNQISEYLYALDTQQLDYLKQLWPSANTVIIPDPQYRLPAFLRGQHSSIAMRVSNHPPVMALCQRFGGAIVSTSANFSGHQTAKTLHQVQLNFANQLDYILPAPLGGLNRATPIYDIVRKQYLR